jgi:hypothetical protein
MEFRFCNPDANTFDQEIKLKLLEDWKVEYVSLTDSTGYWIADNPFQADGFEKYKELVSTFPVSINNNADTCTDPNPFDTIHLPQWMTQGVINLIINFYKNNIEPYSANEEVHEWGNLYWKNKSKPIDAFRMAHVDYPHGIVGNLWFSDHALGTTGTNLYEYKGQVHELFGKNDGNFASFYDFQVDELHPMYKRYKELSTTKRLSKWTNWTDDEAAEFGFVKVGMVPAEYSKLTMYKSSTPHCPYIEDSVDFRWSHTFAFQHSIMTAQDFFK